LPYRSLVSAEELSAPRQIIINDVQFLSVNPWCQTCQDNCFGAILHVSERHHVAQTKVQEDAEGVDSYASRDLCFARTER
jgi:hypothetical protein